jgi:hypothetical protein
MDNFSIRDLIKAHQIIYLLEINDHITIETDDLTDKIVEVVFDEIE